MTIHANYLKDNGFKMGAMMKYGLWISDLTRVNDRPLGPDGSGSSSIGSANSKGPERGGAGGGGDKGDAVMTGKGRQCRAFSGVKTCKGEPRICQKAQQVSHPVYRPGMYMGAAGGAHSGHAGQMRGYVHV